jgi:hypothetical protein
VARLSVRRQIRRLNDNAVKSAKIVIRPALAGLFLKLPPVVRPRKNLAGRRRLRDAERFDVRIVYIPEVINTGRN